MRIASCEPQDDWDGYVEQQAGCSLGHASAWARVLADGYGIETVYLAARDAAGALRGVLPLARFRTLQGSVQLVSLPFLDAAGPLADDPASESALIDAAVALGAPVELRRRPAVGAASVGDATRADLFLPLGGGPDVRWRALPAKVRNQTRKAEREGLALAGADRDLVSDFYKVHCANMRELGTPPHAEGFFRALIRHFGARIRVFVALDGERPVGGLVAIHFGGAVTVPWASTLRGDRPRCPNNLLYWQAIRWAEEVGAMEFCFGRSPVGSGTYRFKRGWGALERPLYWTRVDAASAESPATSAGDSPLLHWLGRLWSRLPARVCNRIGPPLRGRIAS